VEKWGTARKHVGWAKFCVGLHFDSSPGCKDTNMEALLCGRTKCYECRTRWPSGLKRRSTAARLLGSRVRIQLRIWMFVSGVCCVLCS
jgi:hypothetical protein